MLIFVDCVRKFHFMKRIINIVFLWKSVQDNTGRSIQFKIYFRIVSIPHQRRKATRLWLKWMRLQQFFSQEWNGKINQLCYFFSSSKYYHIEVCFSEKMTICRHHQLFEIVNKDNRAHLILTVCEYCAHLRTFSKIYF